MFKTAEDQAVFFNHFNKIKDEYLRRFYVLLYGELIWEGINIFGEGSKIKANNCINFVLDILGLYIKEVDKELEENLNNNSVSRDPMDNEHA